jgi:hypothetical protein
VIIQHIGYGNICEISNLVGSSIPIGHRRDGTGGAPDPRWRRCDCPAFHDDPLGERETGCMGRLCGSADSPGSVLRARKRTGQCRMKSRRCANGDWKVGAISIAGHVPAPLYDTQ